MFLLDDNGWLRILIVTLCLIVAIYFHDLYSDIRLGFRDLQRAGVIAAVAFLAEALLSYLKQAQLVVPARPMIGGTALTILVLLVWRSFAYQVLVKVMPPERVIFLGNSPIVQEIVAQLESHPEKGLAPLGFVGDSGSAYGTRLARSPISAKLSIGCRRTALSSRSPNGA